MNSMTKQLKELLERVETWPEEVQEEAVQTLLAIEEGVGIYHVSDKEWADMQEGIAQADRREFVSDDVVARANRRLGV